MDDEYEENPDRRDFMLCYPDMPIEEVNALFPLVPKKKAAPASRGLPSGTPVSRQSSEANNRAISNAAHNLVAPRGPLVTERDQEEENFDRLWERQANVISHVLYEFVGQQFIIYFRCASSPRAHLQFVIVLENSSRLTGAEIRAMCDCLQLVERGTPFSTRDIPDVVAELSEKHCKVEASVQAQGSQHVITVHPHPAGASSSGSFIGPGRVQFASCTVDSDGDWEVSFESDMDKFQVVVTHKDSGVGSYAILQVRAMRDVLAMAEAETKMDLDIFLQHCARLQQKYNLLQVQCGADNVLYAAVQPSKLTATEARVVLTSSISLPSPHQGALEWSAETQARVAAARPATPAAVVPAGGGRGGASISHSDSGNSAASGGSNGSGEGDGGVQRGGLHCNVTCEACGKSNFFGRRYKCTVCDDYNLCEDCVSEETKDHRVDHELEEVEPPDPAIAALVVRRERLMAVISSSGTKPLVRERAKEELAVLNATEEKKELVAAVKYDFDGESFLVRLTGTSMASVEVHLRVMLASIDSLTLHECRAIRDCCKLGERGTRLSVEEFLSWEEKLRKRHKEVTLNRTEVKLEMIIRCERSGMDASRGMTQAVLLRQDHDNDWVFSFGTCFNNFLIVVNHSLYSDSDSYALLQAKAFGDCLAVACPMEKMDESIFLQQCARLRKKYNLVKVTRADGVVACHIIPSTLSSAEAEVTLNSDMEIPNVHDGELDWSPETYAKLGSAAPAAAGGGMSPPPPPAPGSKLPLYNNGKVYGTKLLKESGQADVYAGVSITKNGKASEVAIKVYHKVEDWNECKEEVMALLRIPVHRNVMGVLDFYESPKPCVIMRLVKGEDLSDYLKKGAMSYNSGLQVLIGMCEGLAHLHKNSIIHRDLKTPNVLLELPSMMPVLIDLGLGKSVGDDDTQKTDGAKGTIPWMAPEMMKDNLWGYHTDIYAMGIMMWEVFSGHKPYSSQGFRNVGQIVACVLRGDRPHLDPVRSTPGMTEQCVDLIKRCWHQDYHERPTADQLLAELTALNHASR